ncbi:MAG: response regulator, partial [Spirochaetales bacterium]
MNVAVVDDEAGVREAVSYALEEAGYEVSCFRDGEEALAAWDPDLPDILILDIIMPKLDGLELCRRVRARSMGTPVIFLSSKDEEIDRVVGLELGADDYVCKPFSVRELVARVRA